MFSTEGLIPSFTQQHNLKYIFRVNRKMFNGITIFFVQQLQF